MKFKSLSNPSLVYGWTEQWLWREGIDSQASQYDTLGDSDTQHTPWYAVAPNQLIDYLESMTAAMIGELAKVVGGDDNACVSWCLPGATSIPEIEFCKTITWKDGKPQWMKNGDHLLSRAESKRFDKRWSEVPKWADTMPTNVVRLVLDRHYPEGNASMLGAAISEAQVRHALNHDWEGFDGIVERVQPADPDRFRSDLVHAVLQLTETSRLLWEVRRTVSWLYDRQAAIRRATEPTPAETVAA